MKNVGHVKDRRSLPRAGVEHFEEGLEVPMRAPDGKTRVTAGLNLKVLSVQRSGEDAGNHFAMFVLGKMDMEWRTLPVRRKRPRQMQFFDAVRVSDTTERESFAVVFEFDHQTRFNRFAWRNCCTRESVMQLPPA